MVTCPNCRNLVKSEVAYINGVAYEYYSCGVCGWNNENMKKTQVINEMRNKTIKSSIDTARRQGSVWS